jgi:hypothetical protein
MTVAASDWLTKNIAIAVADEISIKRLIILSLIYPPQNHQIARTTADLTTTLIL